MEIWKKILVFENCLHFQITELGKVSLFIYG